MGKEGRGKGRLSVKPQSGESVFIHASGTLSVSCISRFHVITATNATNIPLKVGACLVGGR